MPIEGSPKITNLTLTAADTEYSHEFSSGCKEFSFQARTAVDVRFAFAADKVATPTAPYGTLKSGQPYSLGDMKISYGSELTLYAATEVAGTVLEIVEWT